MAKNTHERLEHAEHSEHAAADPFDRRVAVTMAMIAAALAGISMIGHRKHNEVLRLVGEANQLQIEASNTEVKKSNTFAWYQAKRNRQAQYEIAAFQAVQQAGPGGKLPPEVKKWQDDAKTYRHELEEMQKEGEKYGKEATELMAQSRVQHDASVHAHHQADRLDIAHLLAEVGLVVCSVSMLTKKKSFWIGGAVAAAAALTVAGSAYMIPHESHHPTTTHTQPAKH